LTLKVTVVLGKTRVPGLAGDVVFPEVIQKADVAGGVIALSSEHPHVPDCVGIVGGSPTGPRERAVVG